MGSLSQMASGITWAADRGARVANLSFAAAGGYATVQNAAQYMKKKGGLVVTAAGNTGTAQTFAAHASTIVVSGTTSSDAKASWSSYGSFVDIAAPGASIWTTTRGGGYKAASGTSMATPVAAGVVGLMMASNPGLSAEGVESILFSTAVDLGTAGFDTSFGNGRVNASAAVAAAAARAGAVKRGGGGDARDARRPFWRALFLAREFLDQLIELGGALFRLDAFGFACRLGDAFGLAPFGFLAETLAQLLGGVLTVLVGQFGRLLAVEVEAVRRFFQSFEVAHGTRVHAQGNAQGLLL